MNISDVSFLSVSSITKSYSDKLLLPNYNFIASIVCSKYLLSLLAKYPTYFHSIIIYVSKTKLMLKIKIL
jgi:hypothetical protein